MSRARPPESGAGERVHFFNSQALLEHEVCGVEHDRNADAIGNKVWRVIGKHYLLAEQAIGEGCERGHQRRVGLFVGITSSSFM